MSRWTVLVFGVSLVAAATPAMAQTPERVAVTVAAPVFLEADATMTPLRLAREGSVLKVATAEGEWYQVEFDDPQFGRRIGYIEKRHVRVLPPEVSSMEAVDLTVAEARLRPAAAAAQDLWPPVPTRSSKYSLYPAAESAIGWGLLRDSLTQQTSTLGWNVSVAGNLLPWLGLVGDVGGNYKTVADVTLKIHTFLSGVRISGRAGRLVPFGQFVVGLAQSSAGYYGLNASSYDLAMQPGGGVDIGLSDSVALRVQVDFRTIFSEGARFNEVRFVPGIVVRSGSKAF